MKDRIGRFKNIHLNFVPASVARAAAVKRLGASDLSFPGVEFKIASSENRNGWRRLGPDTGSLLWAVCT